MRTVRRLYFYAAALVSLEVVIWGVIGLVRTIFNPGDLGRPVNLLAGSLSLTLVGLPVFLIHWWAAQREALRDPEERSARLRTVFFYGVLGGTLVPALQNALAIANRLTLLALNLQYTPLVGRGQTWSDNLIAIVINLGAAAYFFTILRSDWASDPPGNSLVEVRRLYRYLWVLYGLGITVLGAQQVLRFIFFTSSSMAGSVGYMLADGLALLLAGAPLWVYTWQIVEDTLGPAWRAGFPAANGGSVPAGVGRGWRRAHLYRGGFERGAAPGFRRAAQPVAGTANGRHLHFNRRSNGRGVGILWPPPAGRPAADSRTAAPGRAAPVVCLYPVCFWPGGHFLWSTADPFSGGHYLLTSSQALWGAAMRTQISSALAALAVGLPLWWLTWRPMEAESRGMDATGDHARRSVVRKAYLYLALFSSVIGVMASGGQVIYLVFSQILGAPPAALLARVLDQLELLALFGVWLYYHLRVLRRDGRLAWQALTARHAQFPVIILEPGSGDFSQDIQLALQRGAPGVPVAVQLLSQGIPGPELASARAVILPSQLVHPSPRSSAPLAARFPWRAGHRPGRR